MTWHKLVGPEPRRLRVRLYGLYSDQALVSLTIELRRSDGEPPVDPAPRPPPRSPEQADHEAHAHFAALIQATTATLTRMHEEAVSRLTEELEAMQAHAAGLERLRRAAEREDPAPPPGSRRGSYLQILLVW